VSQISAAARAIAARLAGLLLVTAVLAVSAEDKPSVQGSFRVGGVEAKLTHVRAARVPLDDKGTKGIAVLLSERPSEGDISAWRTADPAERGSFLHIIFDEKGEVWVAELGHAAAKTGRFGVVTELKKVALVVKGDRLNAHVRTAQEESFGDDRFSVDLTFEVTIEGK
jgi:hypothetical protein